MAEIDKMVIGIFIWQLLLSLVVSLFNTLFENSYPELIHFVGNTHFWLVVPSWWLIMTYFVPISLIVTMEMIKLFQGFMLGRDQNGYSEEYETFVSANNTSVNENLGQIKYVFTDKTGTLTKN
jgi:phospholipid-transporting ATPase